MAGDHRSSDQGSTGGRKGDAGRAERLRAALRENLKRRKAQARERSARVPTRDSDPDSAGIVAEVADGKSGD